MVLERSAPNVASDGASLGYQEDAAKSEEPSIRPTLGPWDSEETAKKAVSADGVAKQSRSASEEDVEVREDRAGSKGSVHLDAEVGDAPAAIDNENEQKVGGLGDLSPIEVAEFESDADVPDRETRQEPAQKTCLESALQRDTKNEEEAESVQVIENSVGSASAEEKKTIDPELLHLAGTHTTEERFVFSDEAERTSFIEEDQRPTEWPNESKMATPICEEPSDVSCQPQEIATFGEGQKDTDAMQSLLQTGAVSEGLEEDCMIINGEAEIPLHEKQMIEATPISEQPEASASLREDEGRKPFELPELVEDSPTDPELQSLLEVSQDEVLEQLHPALASIEQPWADDDRGTISCFESINNPTMNDEGMAAGGAPQRKAPAPLDNPNTLDSNRECEEVSNTVEERCHEENSSHWTPVIDPTIDGPDLNIEIEVTEHPIYQKRAVYGIFTKGFVQPTHIHAPSSPGHTGLAPTISDSQIFEDFATPEEVQDHRDLEDDMFTLDVSSYAGTGFQSSAPSFNPNIVEDEPTMTQETTNVKVDFNDDEDILRDFLNRSKANKAVRIAKRTSLSHKRDSDVVKHALASPRRALEDLDANSLLSHRKTKEAEAFIDKVGSPMSRTAENAKDAEDVDELASDEAVPPRRRSRRGDASNQERKDRGVSNPPQTITIRRGDGTERVIIKRSDAQELSMLTRNNTRHNKGGALRVKTVLARIQGGAYASLQEDERESPSRRDDLLDSGLRSVKWKDDQLVSVLEKEASPDVSVETAEDSGDIMPSMSSRPRAKRAMNGTPSKAKTTPKSASAKSERSTKRRKQEQIQKREGNKTESIDTGNQSKANEMEMPERPQEHMQQEDRMTRPQILARKSSNGAPALSKVTSSVPVTGTLNSQADKGNQLSEPASRKPVQQDIHEEKSANVERITEGPRARIGVARSSMVPVRSSGRLRK